MLAGYRVFHDFLITDKPRRIRNIDHIVIGANGVFSVETKTRRKVKGENGAKVTGAPSICTGNKTPNYNSYLCDCNSAKATPNASSPAFRSSKLSRAWSTT
jgi:hypothetical protein